MGSTQLVTLPDGYEIDLDASVLELMETDLNSLRGLRVYCRQSDGYDSLISISEGPYKKVWTQMSGYFLARVDTQPETDVAIILQEPPGKTPYRIRLHGPNSIEMPKDLPGDGIRIIKVEVGELPSGDWFIALELANGQTLNGTCQQIIVDVS
jgi:hypothetical protein